MKINTYRVFAILIDLILTGIFYSVTSNLLNFNGELGSTTISTYTIVYGYSYIIVFYFIYFLAFDIFNNSSTPGKIITRIKVVSKEKEKLAYNKFLRTLLKILSLVVFPISAILFFINGYTIQDQITKTKTIKSK